MVTSSVGAPSGVISAIQHFGTRKVGKIFFYLCPRHAALRRRVKWGIIAAFIAAALLITAHVLWVGSMEGPLLYCGLGVAVLAIAVGGLCHSLLEGPKLVTASRDLCLIQCESLDFVASVPEYQPPENVVRPMEEYPSAME